MLTRDLGRATVVVTGASGGIGAATSIALARRGSNVVLAARRRAALEEVAIRCREAGGDALVVPTDVRDPDEVQRLGERAVAAYGHLDAWVNNAAVACFAPFGEAMAELRSTIETNLLGVAYGTAVALRHLARGGVIVNVGSVLSVATVPYLSSYNASKHAVQGLTDAVQQELSARGDGRVSVCTVLPASVDTPLYRHAANYTGRRLRPPPLAYSPVLIADRIVDVIERPRPQVYPGVARAVAFAWRLMPGLSRRLAARLGDRMIFTTGTAGPTSGNALGPQPEPSRISGGWHGSARPLLRSVVGGTRSPAWLRLRGR